MQPVIELAKQLIALPSITPDDAGCQTILAQRLQALGFSVEHLPFGKVKNIWARHGNAAPLLVFIGHTDVVPTGLIDQWQSHPFKPEIRDGFLYGRGSADMKGSIAAMLIACENFIAKHPQHRGAIAWLITSDEEGPSVDGTAKVAELLKQRGEKIDWCLVGEPSSAKQLGDSLKIGRRGTLSATLIIHGKQGHIAYPQLADNPIHKILPMLNELINTQWDAGYEFFQPTSLQISNIHAGTGAGNVIPGALETQFNFRYSPAVTAEQLQQRVTDLLKKYNLLFDIQWRHSGLPFLTTRGELVDACCAVIKDICNITPVLSTIGGTSDGRFIAPLGAQVVELGPCNHTIHHVNECVAVDELINLVTIYEKILEKLLT
jgi:succinyl-diaminopimelate desuccinylase